MDTSYKLKYTGEEIDEILGKADTNVLTISSQSLTEPQKAQVRENIGVTPEDDRNIHDGEGENSIEQVNGTALGANSAAFGLQTKTCAPEAFAEGHGNFAGTKAFTITNIQLVGEQYLFFADTSTLPTHDGTFKVCIYTGKTNIDNVSVTFGTIETQDDAIVLTGITTTFDLENNPYVWFVDYPEYGDIETGVGAHAEGYESKALAVASHAEGFGNVASGEGSHAEGINTMASGNGSHASGIDTIAGIKGFTIRYLTISGSSGSTWTTMNADIDKFTLPESATILDGDHVNLSSAVYSWVSFNSFTITGVNGILWLPGDTYSLQVNASDLPQEFVAAVQSMIGQGLLPLNVPLSEEYLGGSYVWFPDSSFRVIGQGDADISLGSYASGRETYSLATATHTEGENTEALSYCAHAEGNDTKASGVDSHAEGHYTKAEGQCAHSEGNTTVASGNNSRSSGFGTRAEGENSVAEGRYVKASGSASHAEGYSSVFGNIVASGRGSHAEGVDSHGYVHALGVGSHAEGTHTVASGDFSHAEGDSTTASGVASHAGGIGTIASGVGQTVVGKYNYADANALFIIGNGSNDTLRQNLFTVYNNFLNFYLNGGQISFRNSDSNFGTLTLSTAADSTAIEFGRSGISADIWEYIQGDYERTFQGTISWPDLITGARGGKDFSIWFSPDTLQLGYKQLHLSDAYEVSSCGFITIGVDSTDEYLPKIYLNGGFEDKQTTIKDGKIDLTGYDRQISMDVASISGAITIEGLDNDDNVRKKIQIGSNNISFYEKLNQQWNLASTVIKSTDYATQQTAGVIKVNSNYGIQLDRSSQTSPQSGDMIILPVLSAADINNRNSLSERRALLLNWVDYAVKKSLTTNSQTLTDEEKTAALAWLGIPDLTNYVQKTDLATDSKAGVVKVNSYNGIQLTSNALCIVSPQNTTIDNRNGGSALYARTALTVNKIDYAVYKALTTASWTAEQKAEIRAFLGIS